MTEALNSVIELTFFIITIRILIIVATAALITWVVKKVWNAGNKKAPKVHKPKPHNQWTDNWVENASVRQNNRYKYTDPTWTESEKKWSPTGWYYDEEKGKWFSPDYRDGSKNTNLPTYEASKDWLYNESARMWVDSEQLEQHRHQRAYQENRKRWKDFAEQEAEEKRIQAALREQRKPAELTQEEKDLSKQIRPDRAEPSYEEWKAARLKEQQDKQ